jgi:hypothetical protein
MHQITRKKYLRKFLLLFYMSWGIFTLIFLPFHVDSRITKNSCSWPELLSIFENTWSFSFFSQITRSIKKFLILFSKTRISFSFQNMNNFSIQKVFILTMSFWLCETNYRYCMGTRFSWNPSINFSISSIVKTCL